QLYLYDTFEGMTKPTELDKSYDGAAASDQLKSVPERTGVWCYAQLDEVRANLLSTSYPTEHLHFIRGRVEDTIPTQVPPQIALLRLDTDWYESTRHELEHLYPLLSHGGVIIIDDYGHWQGAKKATDEFFNAMRTPILFNRLDYTGRIAVKL